MGHDSVMICTILGSGSASSGSLLEGVAKGVATEHLVINLVPSVHQYSLISCKLQIDPEISALLLGQR